MGTEVNLEIYNLIELFVVAIFQNTEVGISILMIITLKLNLKYYYERYKNILKTRSKTIKKEKSELLFYLSLEIT